MPQDRPQRVRAQQLWAQLLVAARRTDDHRRAAAQAEVDRVVGRGVAGVQRDHHVDRLNGTAAHIAFVEAQAGQPQPVHHRVAQLHHVGPQLDADHLRIDARLPAQVIVNREGQVALAGAEIDHADRALVAGRGGRIGIEQGRGAQRAGDHLDELVDLLPLARHRRHHRVLRGGDAQLGQEGPGHVDPAVLLAVVRAGLGRRVGEVCSSLVHKRLASKRAHTSLTDHQLDLLALRAQVCVAEHRPQQVANGSPCGLHRQVLRHVARGVAVDEGHPRLTAQHDRAQGDALQVGLGPTVLRQQQGDETAVIETRSAAREKAVEAGCAGRGFGRRREGDHSRCANDGHSQHRCARIPTFSHPPGRDYCVPASRVSGSTAPVWCSAPAPLWPPSPAPDCRLPTGRASPAPAGRSAPRRPSRR